ncbi:LPS export ABC transporter periplasmic protein LptC [Reinekea sp.]|jgi:LPS export ABC transporter protein LptC|uniref:LPS export ABC transporter periplasmic protein LptC n=1 Tax=Reinekea sp. TaxID=1970455 RepID=UPI003988EC01
MIQSRSFFPVLIAILAAILYFFLKPEEVQYLPEQSIQLPEDSPDAYMTDVNITRYNEQGIAVLYAQGESLAMYENPQRSQFNQPTIHLVENGTLTWKITANTANIDENDIIEFHENVIATQLSATPALILVTEFLSINNELQTIETDLPVQLTQGSQRVNAIGMDAQMDTMGSNIHFQSEVSFVYDL